LRDTPRVNLNQLPCLEVLPWNVATGSTYLPVAMSQQTVDK